MTIDLSDIASKAGRTRVEVIDPSLMEAEELPGGHLNFSVESISPFDLSIRNAEGKKLSVSGRTDAHLKSVCDRCLEDVFMDIPVEISLVIDIVHGEIAADRDDPMHFLDGDILDVGGLISDEILLHLPSKVLCQDDCRGLCVKCGRNLNLGDCGCERQSLDPRMQQFLDVFNEMSQEV